MIRHPRSERSPGLEPLFDRCSANGAPQSLHTKPTHDWLSAASAAFFVAAVLFVEELLSTGKYASFPPLGVYPIAHPNGAQPGNVAVSVNEKCIVAPLELTTNH